MKRITRCIASLLASRGFAIGVLVFVVLEGLWVACSAMYPMAFDEDFHFGLIRIYSHHWLPFLSGQPPDAGKFGAVARDPSYLYHYLMSFPYRLTELVTQSQTAQVLVLRFLNVGMFAGGVALFYKVLRRAGSPRTVANVALAIFALIPIAPLLAGQINYDNLMLLVAAWTCLLVFRLDAGLRQRTLDLPALALLAAACLLGCLVKYAFLPLAFAAVGFVAFRAWRAFRGHRPQLRPAWTEAYRRLTSRTKVGLLVLLVVAAGLFTQRYGLNVVAYHTPLPPCNVVLDTDECMSYGPWARNYRYAHSKGDFDRNVFSYTWGWLQGMHYRLFFMVNGPTAGYRSYPPIPLPAATAVALTVSGTLALMFYWRRVFGGQPYMAFLFLTGALYCLVLWADNYKDFLSTGRPVAVNGRYLLVVLLPLMAVLGRALWLALDAWPRLRTAVAALAVLFFLQGGGVLSFILRTDATWDWHSSTVVHINNGAREVLAPFVIEGSKYY